MLPGGPSRWIDVYNRGQAPLQITAVDSEPWVRITPAAATVDEQIRLEVDVEWSLLSQAANKPANEVQAQVTIRDSQQFEREIVVTAYLPPSDTKAFVAANGFVSIDAASFEHAVNADGIVWTVLPDHGRTGSSVMATPVTAAPTSLEKSGPHLEYPVFLTSAGRWTVDVYLSPTLDFYGADATGKDPGLRFAISFDEDDPIVIDMHTERSTPEKNFNLWRRRVAKNIHIAPAGPFKLTPGNHTLKFWRIDSGPVLQKLIVRENSIPDSYLGPPETPRGEFDTTE